MSYKHRHTKIVFTIGPASEDEATLETLVRAGVDVCRVNMAHASHESTRTVARRLRKVCKKVGRQIGVMMDIKGPEVRTGVVAAPIELVENETLYLGINEAIISKLPEGARGVTVNYPNIVNDLNAGDTVLVDSGMIVLKVVSKTAELVECCVVTPGKLTSRRHINLPGIYVNLPAITEKDKADIQVGIEEGVAFFALSFARTAADVQELRQYLTAHNSKAHILAKIEDQSGVKHLEAIIEASDGLMVARGDLGIECPFEQLPVIQRNAVRLCTEKGKPVIVATHMLESMITAPVPTRAEVTDIANAVYQKADCIMLSGETSQGKYPVECVQVMKKIAYQVESDATAAYNTHIEMGSPKDKLLRSAVDLASQLQPAAILFFTDTDKIGNTLASLRPMNSPLFGFTEDLLTLECLRLVWSVEPFLMPFSKNAADTVNKAITLLKEKGFIKQGDSIVILPHAEAEDTQLGETIQMRVI
jgi:pyruvate kinase